MRQKTLIIILVISTIIAGWAWYENTLAIDFFVTKNHHLTNRKKAEIMNEKNIDTLRKKSIDIIDNFESHRRLVDKRAVKAQNMLAAINCVLFLALIVSIFDFWKKIAADRIESVSSQA